MLAHRHDRPKSIWCLLPLSIEEPTVRWDLEGGQNFPWQRCLRRHTLDDGSAALDFCVDIQGLCRFQAAAAAADIDEVVICQLDYKMDSTGSLLVAKTGQQM